MAIGDDFLPLSLKWFQRKKCKLPLCSRHRQTLEIVNKRTQCRLVDCCAVSSAAGSILDIFFDLSMKYDMKHCQDSSPSFPQFLAKEPQAIFVEKIYNNSIIFKFIVLPNF